MNDDFLNVLRQDPSPEFAHKLRMRLRSIDTETRVARRVPRAARWVAIAASLMATAFAFTFPAVRAGAQSFLDLFRVVNFAGVAFDLERLNERLARLPSDRLDLTEMIGGDFEVLKQPRAAVAYSTAEEAGTAAGFRVRTPAWLPTGYAISSVQVAGDGETRFTANTANLKLLLDALAINDVTIPAGIDGKDFHVRVPPVVRITYGGNRLAEVTLTEARTPEVLLPAGLDMTALGEIGLRLLGLSRNEAYRMAQNIDWRTTLLVPVPVNAASFRQVNIQGENALLIQAYNARSDSSRGGEAILLWSQQGIVHALTGPTSPQILTGIAEALQ